ncbi:nucleotide sugar dehydrogenase [Streptococcus parauberis]|uniref:UDP-glucose 6-dehydrogenase n=1 Tax=Streptococcus parauberis NCFD 2020 TaxID=873447 RepID=F1Z271_9STRE|nr:nucleotide sugar dehydrogenase [Streptococcus parauberis]EGE54123.1 nucleotide sugar dehydrogenase [Streptococcus parauberis NCFD 2020]EMF48642.1 UDP-glucose dehydrogenase [Streptococcus parauberis KRS-02109]PNY20381.1 UDP-glucose 6-dehydrogenase [Streptococcus parauberis]UWM86833.1 nucleotide sugar dehydrogenase [Streptococcus parauberis]UWM88806.1 nucleotide sugar dehydrogenase [Streptococcus parauberis]
MKITVAGSGYVGLSLGVLLAQTNPVTIVDIVEEKVKLINQRKSPIQDKEIESYLAEKPLSLTATLDGDSAYSQADLIIVATPTNYNSDIDFFDTKHVEAVISQALKVNDKAIIVIKSTIPMGFIKQVREQFKTDRIIFSPEFLRESKALHDNLHPSRIIVSYEKEDSAATIEAAREFGKLLKEAALTKEVPLLFMGTDEAEAVKLFANTYLAMRVSYFNELDTYAEAKGLDVQRVIEGICRDRRIGEHYNNPSFGYGGYCLPKDTKQLLANYKDTPQALISAIVASNQKRKEFIAERIKELLKDRDENDKEPTVGVHRLIMKSNSDNFRESAIKDVMDLLSSYQIRVLIYEPMLEEELDYEVTKNLDSFKKESTIIVSNRFDRSLADVGHKVYTRDIFGID